MRRECETLELEIIYIDILFTAEYLSPRSPAVVRAVPLSVTVLDLKTLLPLLYVVCFRLVRFVESGEDHHVKPLTHR